MVRNLKEKKIKGLYELWVNEETKNIKIHTNVDVKMVDYHFKFDSKIVRKLVL